MALDPETKLLRQRATKSVSLFMAQTTANSEQKSVVWDTVYDMTLMMSEEDHAELLEYYEDWIASQQKMMEDYAKIVDILLEQGVVDRT